MAKGISIMSRLLNYVNFNNGKKTDADIALSILENYHKIPELTIYDLADLCYVSASSITRFIRSLGYHSFKEFKEDIKETITIDVDYSKNVNMATADDLQPIFQRYTDNVIENIRYTYDQINYDQLARIGRYLYEANEIAFFGLEYANYVGMHFQNKMAALNRFVHLGTSDARQKELAESLEEGSVVIIVSLEGGFFYHHDDIMEILHQKHCKIISVTMLTIGKVLNYSTEVVLCNKTNSSTEGRITIMYFIELLIMYYYINYSKN